MTENHDEHGIHQQPILDHSASVENLATESNGSVNLSVAMYPARIIFVKLAGILIGALAGGVLSQFEGLGAHATHQARDFFILLWAVLGAIAGGCWFGGRLGKIGSNLLTGCILCAMLTKLANGMSRDPTPILVGAAVGLVLGFLRGALQEIRDYNIAQEN